MSLDIEDAQALYAKIDWEGGFWEAFEHSGSGLLDGTPFEEYQEIFIEAKRLAKEYISWIEHYIDNFDGELGEDDDDSPIPSMESVSMDETAYD